MFHYESMELVASARSYFGGLLCVCWSPDGKYLVLGGEDDLVTVYSFHERRVVVRGQGHKSWVSVVSFDVYNMAYDALPDGLDFSGSDDESSSGAVPAINSPTTSHRSEYCLLIGQLHLILSSDWSIYQLLVYDWSIVTLINL